MKRGTATWLLAASIVLSCALADRAFGDTTLRAMRLTSTADGARLELELSGKTRHQLFKLAHPDRIVVDFADTGVLSGLRIPRGFGAVSAIRVGPQPTHGLRLALDLSAPLDARAVWAHSEAGPGYRLTLELRGRSPGRVQANAKPGANATASTASVDVGAPPIDRRPAHAPIDTGRDVIIAIDAGHGGEDPGAIGRGGTREKDVVLAIARTLAEVIDREPGMHAVLTRDGDYFIALRERIRRARAAKADLFVSIHADSVLDREVAGASVYVLSEKGASNEAARWLAERENAADLKGGIKLDDKDNVLASVLLDLSQTASIGSSAEAAAQVLAAIERVGDVRKPRVQQAGFVVLKSPDIPSMLVETAYISNPSEERRLASDAHQQQLATAIFEGVRAYFEASPPDGTRFALRKRAAAALASNGYTAD